MSPKWSILCWVERKALTQSVNLSRFSVSSFCQWPLHSWHVQTIFIYLSSSPGSLVPVPTVSSLSYCTFHALPLTVNPNVHLIILISALYNVVCSVVVDAGGGDQSDDDVGGWGWWGGVAAGALTGRVLGARADTASDSLLARAAATRHDLQVGRSGPDSCSFSNHGQHSGFIHLTTSHICTDVVLKIAVLFSRLLNTGILG